MAQMPADRTDIRSWVDFFSETRAEVLKNEGRDIAEDKEIMFGWFVNLYMNGHDEARIEQMFKEAGVTDIEGYLKTFDRSTR